MKKDCIFCKIIEGKIPAAKVFENKSVIAFLDIAPGNEGHCLVVPKSHHETLLDLPEKELCEMVKALKLVTEAVVHAMDPDGFNILMNNKEIAGQLVPHAHFHIIPRVKEDGLKFDWPQKKYANGKMEETRKKIAEFLE